MNEPSTHPKKPTLGSNEASPEAKRLVEDLQDILRCEEAWYIAQTHIDRVKETIEAKYAAILASKPDPRVLSPYDPEGVLDALLG